MLNAIERVSHDRYLVRLEDTEQGVKVQLCDMHFDITYPFHGIAIDGAELTGDSPEALRELLFATIGTADKFQLHVHRDQQGRRVIRYGEYGLKGGGWGLSNIVGTALGAAQIGVGVFITVSTVGLGASAGGALIGSGVETARYSLTTEDENYDASELAARAGVAAAAGALSGGVSSFAGAAVGAGVGAAASSTMNTVRETGELPSAGQLAKDTVVGAAAGMVGGAAGKIAGNAATKLVGEAADDVVVAVTKGVAEGAGGGAAGRVTANVCNGKKWNEGVVESATTGAFIGGSIAGAKAMQERAQAAAQKEPIEEKKSSGADDKDAKGDEHPEQKSQAGDKPSDEAQETKGAQKPVEKQTQSEAEQSKADTSKSADSQEAQANSPQNQKLQESQAKLDTSQRQLDKATQRAAAAKIAKEEYGKSHDGVFKLQRHVGGAGDKYSDLKHDLARANADVKRQETNHARVNREHIRAQQAAATPPAPAAATPAAATTPPAATPPAPPAAPNYLNSIINQSSIVEEGTVSNPVQILAAELQPDPHEALESRRVEVADAMTENAAGRYGDPETYLYTNDDITRLLQHYVDGLGTDANVRSHSNVDFDNDSREAFHSAVREFINSDKEARADHTLIPIQISHNHRMLLYVHYEYEEEVAQISEVKLFDPKTDTETTNNISGTLTEANIFADDDLTILPESALQSDTDAYNSGPWIVEVARALMSNDALPDAVHDISAAKTEHVGILSQPTELERVVIDVRALRTVVQERMVAIRGDGEAENVVPVDGDADEAEAVQAETQDIIERDPVESFVKSQWIQILGLETATDALDINTSFNAIDAAYQGADAQIREKWRILINNIESRYLIKLDGITQFCCIRQLAAEIKSKVKQSRSLKRFYMYDASESDESSSGLFFIHPVMGGLSEFMRVFRNTDTAFLAEQRLAVYGYCSPLLEPELPDDYDELCSMARQAELAIDAMRCVQPHGPYRLTGWSYGGVLAIEIARQLRANGEEVDYVGLVDPQLPDRFRSLSKEEMQQRLLMHINFIGNFILNREGLLPTITLVTEGAVDFNDYQNHAELINSVFVIAYAQLETHREKTGYAKLKGILHALKANYLAINAYQPAELLRDNRLLYTNVYVADEGTGVLPYMEYERGDASACTAGRALESTIPHSNHFDIVGQRLCAAKMMRHIKNIPEVKLADTMWLYLKAHYEQQTGAPGVFFYDDRVLPILDLDVPLQQQQQTADLARIFETGSDALHVLVKANLGMGKSVLSQQLVKRWLNNEPNFWAQKRWVFYLPIQVLQHYDFPSGEDFIVSLLYQHYFRERGVSYEDVKQFWQYIQGEPERICFILDGVDSVINMRDQKLNRVIQAFMTKPMAVIVTSRDYLLTELQRLSFALQNEHTYEIDRLNREQQEAFIVKYFANNITLKESLLRWLSTNRVIAELCEVPVHLSMLCSLWNHQQQQALAEVPDISIQRIIEHSVYNMLRRYLVYADLTALMRLQHIADAELNRQTEEVSNFLAYVAFHAVTQQTDVHVIQPNDMSRYLQEFIGDGSSEDCFRNVLISGFIDPVTYSQREIARAFKFNSQIMQLYFSCQYVRQLLQAELSPDKLEAISDFIIKALNLFEPNLLYTWLFQGDVENLTALLEALKLIQHDYSIELVRFVTHALEAAHTRDDIGEELKADVLKKVGKSLYCFTSETWTRQYAVNEQRDTPNLSSPELAAYQEAIGKLKIECSNVFAALTLPESEEEYAADYDVGDSVLHYAVRKRDIPLIRRMLLLNADVEQRNDAGERPVDIAYTEGFVEGVDELHNLQLIAALQKLHQSLLTQPNQRLAFDIWQRLMSRGLQRFVTQYRRASRHLSSKWSERVKAAELHAVEEMCVAWRCDISDSNQLEIFFAELFRCCQLVIDESANVAEQTQVAEMAGCITDPAIDGLSRNESFLTGFLSALGHDASDGNIREVMRENRPFLLKYLIQQYRSQTLSNMSLALQNVLQEIFTRACRLSCREELTDNTVNRITISLSEGDDVQALVADMNEVMVVASSSRGAARRSVPSASARELAALRGLHVVAGSAPSSAPGAGLSSGSASTSPEASDEGDARRSPRRRRGSQ